MRELTPTESSSLTERRKLFEKFKDERRPLLVDFFKKLEMTNPFDVLRESERFLQPFDTWLGKQVVAEDLWHWLLVRVAYFIGEIFIQRYAGVWYVEDDPDSRFFGKFVVGRFERRLGTGLLVDPFEAAAALISQPMGRSLSDLVNGIDSKLTGASQPL